MIKRTLFTSVLISLLVACGSNVKEQVPKVYTQKENNYLTYCMGLSTTASNASSEKLSGKTESQVKRFYANKPHENINIKVVEEIYDMQEKSNWAYTVKFFDNCANALAKVDSSRVSYSNICMQRQLVGDIAHGYKSSGEAKAGAYSLFSSHNNSKVNEIIDFIYSNKFSRTEAKKKLWQPCIDQYTIN